MKRIISPLFIILLCLALVGCSSMASDLEGEDYSGSISEPIADVEEGDRLKGTWEANYNGSKVILAIHNNGSYELYQKKNDFTALVTGTYSDANDTLTFTPETVEQDGEGEFDFEDTVHIPYTLEGNSLNTVINNQHILFTRDIDSGE